MQRITLLEVAERAGVSVSTVSRSLANHPRIPLETRQRICNLAKEMGYRPDPALSALVSHRQGINRPGDGANLAFLTDLGEDHLNAYYQGIFDGAKAEVKAMGYCIERFDFHKYPNPSAVGRVLEQRGVAGLIVCPIHESRVLNEFPWEKFSNVGFLLPIYHPQVHMVRDNSFRTVYEAFMTAARRGYRRPGLVIYTERRSANTIRQLGGQYAAQASYKDWIDPLDPLILSSTPHDTERIREWLKVQRADCVICTNTTLFWILQDMGLRIPDDLGFITLWLEPNDPGFSGFTPRTGQIGQVLVNLLDGLIKRNERGLAEHPIVSLVNRVWVEGKTLPMRRAETISDSEVFDENLLP
ncbi:MAG: LacI family DNA-binding transcriptional regulator [Verrucomicrobiota bacterium]|nr:LacI family DNA-binding transcriptional regulator [Verrucomicrobiota bacterium]